MTPSRSRPPTRARPPARSRGVVAPAGLAASVLLLLSVAVGLAGQGAADARADGATRDPVPGAPVAEDAVIRNLLAQFDRAPLVALGENHGHLELHELILKLLETAGARERIDDVVVEFGNARYQGVVDRWVAGGEVPWDSVALAWRNSVVSPNPVWDSPVYARFFREGRRINRERPDGGRYRVVLADSPVPWDSVSSREELAPWFDRVGSMAAVIESETLGRGRTGLFLAGGLHVHRRARSWPSNDGGTFDEPTVVSTLDAAGPGRVRVVQSMGAAERLGVEELLGSTSVRWIDTAEDEGVGAVPGSSVTTLRGPDGGRPDVYPDTPLRELVDAVLLWPAGSVTLLGPSAEAFADDGRWRELNRRSRLLRGEPMDPALRGGG